jgi:serine/threonine protein kinase
LNHPNIINCIGSEIINSNLLIYLEYVPGGSLGDLIQRYGPLSEKLIKIYLRQILKGLQYLHSKGIVHRDIKAANILLDTNGVIKLTDFGCSGQISLSSSHSENNLLNSIKGSIPWMAPEVICQNRYGCKADVWSLGCLLIELKTGKSPWGKLDNIVQALFKIGRSNAIPEFPLDISDSLKDFLCMCINRNPQNRSDVTSLLNHPFLF